MTQGNNPFSQELKQDVTSILKNASHVVNQYESGQWKNPGDPQLEASYQFSKQIMSIFGKYESDIGIQPPELVGSGTGGGSGGKH